MKYFAFLRGINVGGHTKVEMAALKNSLTKLGFSDIRTVLNSGNLAFESSDSDPAALTTKIEAQLEADFGFPIAVILRTEQQMTALIKDQPFKTTKVTPATRLLVTFLADPPKEICNVIEVVPGAGTPELMAKLEKQYGKRITTRTWGTLLKLVNL